MHGAGSSAQLADLHSVQGLRVSRTKALMQPAAQWCSHKHLVRRQRESSQAPSVRLPSLPRTVRRDRSSEGWAWGQSVGALRVGGAEPCSPEQVAAAIASRNRAHEARSKPNGTLGRNVAGGAEKSTTHRAVGFSLPTGEMAAPPVNACPERTSTAE